MTFNKLKIGERKRTTTMIRRANHSAANRVEAVVIGAGVIGLAVARALALKGKEVLIVERASTIGSGESTLPVSDRCTAAPCRYVLSIKSNACTRYCCQYHRLI